MSAERIKRFIELSTELAEEVERMELDYQLGTAEQWHAHNLVKDASARLWSAAAWLEQDAAKRVRH